MKSGWVHTTLGMVADWGSGGTPSRSNKDFFIGEIPWIKTGELGSKYIRKTEESISTQAIEYSAAKIFPKGSIGIAMYGATIGKLSIFGISASTNQACAVAVPIVDLLFNEYLYFYLLSERRNLINAGKGGAQPNISQGVLKDWVIPLSPPPEQRRIVSKIEELFSELDKGIETLKTAKSQLAVYRQAILKDAFEGKLTAKWRTAHPETEKPASFLARLIGKRLAKKKREFVPTPAPADLPAEWTLTRILQIADTGTGATPLKSNSEYYEGGNIPWVTSGALNDSYVELASGFVTDKALNETNLRLYPKHTLLVALYGEGRTRGKCSELVIEATTNQAIAAITLDSDQATLRSYLKYFLLKNYQDMRRMSSGGVQPNLNLGIIQNMIIPICSENEAAEIVAHLDAQFSIIDSLESDIKTNLQKTEALRQSILKKAFAGELVPQDPSDEPAAVLLERIRVEREIKQTQSTKRSSISKPNARGRKPRAATT